MNKRTATGAKPPAASPAKPEDAKKPATTTLRTDTAKPPIAPTPSRTSALVSRTSGSSINKPPTRPVLASAKKPAGRGSEDGAAATLSNGDENKRPARMSATGSMGARTARPDSAQDKARRTTIAGSAASAPLQRPLTGPRTSTASPTKAQPAMVTSKRPNSSVAKGGMSPTSPSKKGAVRPLATATIPEEVESVLDATSHVVSLARPKESQMARPPSPPKLEIRSINYASDTEATRPKPLSRHSRTQSAQVRPSTAPGQPMTDQEQSRRDLEIVQNLFRESTRRDSLTAEVKDLKSDLARLEQRNRQLAEAAKIAPKHDPAAEAAKEKAITDRMQKKHTMELETLRTSHKGALSSLESKHIAELSNLRSELENQRRQSSRLEGVETKIEAVESALRESKKRASQNEQGLQQTIQQKEQDTDKLARVIEDLRQEIDRCQVKLNQDVANHMKEKKEAQKLSEQLRKELDQEKKRSRDAAERSEKEKIDSHERFEVALRENRSLVQQETERLRQAEADAKEGGKRLQDELDSVRKRDGEQFEKNQTALDDSVNTIQSLQDELQKLKDDHLGSFERQRQRAEDGESLANDLRNELQSLQQIRDNEQSSSEELRERMQKTVDELEEQVRKLQKDGGDGTKVVESLQDKLRDMQQLEYDADGKHESELSELRYVVESLQADSSKLQQAHAESLAQKDQDATTLTTAIEESQHKTNELQQQLEAAVRSRDEDATQLNETIESLKQEASALQQRAEEQAAAKEKENTELVAVVEALQAKVHEHQQAADFARNEAEQANGANGQVIEHLQNEVQSVQHQLHDERSARQHAETQLQSISEAHDVLVEQLDELRLAREDVAKDVVQKSQRIEELLFSLGDAEAAKSSAEASLSSLKEEMSGSQKVLDSFKEDAEERETSHGEALLQLRRELGDQHDRELESAREEHGRELQEVSGSRTDAEASLATMKEEMAGLQKVLDAFKEDADETEVGHGEAIVELRRELGEQRDRDLESLKEQHGRELWEVSESKSSAETSLAITETSLAAAKGEMAGLQKILESFKQDAGEKEAAHADALETLRRQLDKQHGTELARLQAEHERDLEQLQQASTKDGRPDAELQQKYADVLQEKRALDKMLEDLETQQNKRLQEQARKHDTYSAELQQSHADLLQEKEALSRDLGDAESQLSNRLQEQAREHAEACRGLQHMLDQAKEDHECELQRFRQGTSEDDTAIAVLQQKYDDLLQERRALEEASQAVDKQYNERLHRQAQEHDVAYQTLQKNLDEVKEGSAKQLNEQSQRHEEMCRELQDLIQRLREEHEIAGDSLTAEHERNIQAVMDKHAAQVAQVEEEASRRTEAAGSERDRIHEAALAALEAEHAEALHEATLSSHQKLESNHLAPETPSKGLSHVFVHQEDEYEDETPGLPETPLAYASDEEQHYSPTPAYPKDGKRAGAELASVKRPNVKHLERENAELLAQLRAAQDELVVLKAPPAPQPQSREAPSAARPAYHIGDPFAPHTNGHHISPHTNGHTNGDWDGKMTLEGTLESIRVQTEQLLEINDDFIAEQRRWSRNLGTTRSQRSSYSSLLKAVPS